VTRVKTLLRLDIAFYAGVLIMNELNIAYCKNSAAHNDFIWGLSEVTVTYEKRLGS
jgi:hypothetical protein